MERIQATRGAMKTYPDITRLLKAKMERRRELARLSFEEKIEIVNKWRELSRQICSSRERDLVANRQRTVDRS